MLSRITYLFFECSPEHVKAGVIAAGGDSYIKQPHCGLQTALSLQQRCSLGNNKERGEGRDVMHVDACNSTPLQHTHFDCSASM